MDKKFERRLAEVASRVELAVKEEFGLRWWRLTKEDEIRCLRLEQWEQKHCVSLRWILRTLVPLWKKKFARFAPGAFGVKIPTLVGSKSEDILKGKIAELYPDGENVRQWKSAQQQKQWSLYRQGIGRKENWEHPLRAAREYQQRMKRERLARMEFARRARLRPYRGNPWL